jgi:hypothetical protein
VRSERDELVVVIALLFAGVLGRLMFGRPWTVAARHDDGELQTWQARSYGEMRKPSAGSLTTSPRAPSQRAPDGLMT